MVAVTVIIVNYNSGHRLGACLDALEASTFKDFAVTVVDNASTDGSERLAHDRDIHVDLIKSEVNLGFAEGNNLAAKDAKGDWLAFLNPDAYAAPGWLQALMSATQRYPDVEAFGATQISAHNKAMLDGVGDCYFFGGVPYRGHHGWRKETLPPEAEVFSACGAAALYKRSAFEALGGFDKRFFCYVEDVDLGFRLRLKGGKTMQIPDAVVHHEGSAISGDGSPFTIYHGHRNRIWTHFLNLPIALLVVSLPVHLLANVYLLFRFLFAGRSGPYLRALRDGYAALPSLCGDRRKRMAGRRASLNDLARAMTWSPTKLWRKKADLKS